MPLLSDGANRGRHAPVRGLRARRAHERRAVAAAAAAALRRALRISQRATARRSRGHAIRRPGRGRAVRDGDARLHVDECGLSLALVLRRGHGARAVRRTPRTWATRKRASTRRSSKTSRRCRGATTRSAFAAGSTLRAFFYEDTPALAGLAQDAAQVFGAQVAGRDQRLRGLLDECEIALAIGIALEDRAPRIAGLLALGGVERQRLEGALRLTSRRRARAWRRRAPSPCRSRAAPRLGERSPAISLPSASTCGSSTGNAAPTFGGSNTIPSLAYFEPKSMRTGPRGATAKSTPGMAGNSVASARRVCALPASDRRSRAAPRRRRPRRRASEQRTHEPGVGVRVVGQPARGNARRKRRRAVLRAREQIDARAVERRQVAPAVDGDVRQRRGAAPIFVGRIGVEDFGTNAGATRISKLSLTPLTASVCTASVNGYTSFG